MNIGITCIILKFFLDVLLVKPDDALLAHSASILSTSARISCQLNLLIIKGGRLGAVVVVRGSAALMNERCQPLIVVVEEVAGLGDPPLVVSPHMV